MIEEEATRSFCEIVSNIFFVTIANITGTETVATVTRQIYTHCIWH